MSRLADQALSRVALTLEKTMNFDRAIEAYEALLELFPTSRDAAIAASNIARLHEALMHYLPAAAAYERYARLFPAADDAAAIQFRAALVYRHAGAVAEERSALKTFLKRYAAKADKALVAKAKKRSRRFDSPSPRPSPTGRGRYFREARVSAKVSFVRHSALLILLSALLLSGCANTTSTCSPVNCAGCCDADGECREGTTNDACGAAALNCNVCSGGQVCTDKRCVLPMQQVVDSGVPFDAGMPIVAPVETWTWAGFPNSACGNGAPTGVGINISTRSSDLMIFLMAGGACWDSLTCAFAATNLNSGYGATDFAQETTLRAAPFNRAEPTNPFKDMSYVFVPYCTGDVHSGDNVRSYPAVGTQIPARTVHHKGRTNLDAFLVRLHDTFPDVTRVFLSGSSAGAFGAQLNFDRVSATWPNAEVHVLADCAQIVNPSGTLLSQWRAAWNLEIPPGCTGCETDLALFPKFLHDSAPNRRFGLLAYTQDSTLRQFAGYDGATFEMRTLALSSSAYDTTSNAKYFIVGGSNHVMLDELQTLQGPGGASLLSWLQAFVNGSPSWQSVKP